MKEKFNNFEYIYTYMQLFYKYADDEILKSVLTNITRNILNNILLNITLKDIQVLKSCREKTNYIEKNFNSEPQNFKIMSKIAHDINKNIQEITNRNVDKFLKNPDDTITNTIFILF